MIRQCSAIARTEGSELTVQFERETRADAVLCVAFLLPKASIASVDDNLGGGALWRCANREQRVPLELRFEAWYRNCGFEVLVNHSVFPSLIYSRTVQGPPGVIAITGRVSNGLAVPISGVAIECPRGTRIGDAVQRLHDLLLEAGVGACA